MKLITAFFLAVVSALSCEAAEPDRTIIPLPEPAFAGKIGKTYKDSEAAWLKLPAPPKGAPNVPLIMLHDEGLGNRECVFFRYKSDLMAVRLREYKEHVKVILPQSTFMHIRGGFRQGHVNEVSQLYDFRQLRILLAEFRQRPA
jgi:hypothetical protein